MRGTIRRRTLRIHLPMQDKAKAGRTDVPETAALCTRATAMRTSRAFLPYPSMPGFPRLTSFCSAHP